MTACERDVARMWTQEDAETVEEAARRLRRNRRLSGEFSRASMMNALESGGRKSLRLLLEYGELHAFGEMQLQNLSLTATSQLPIEL